MSQYPMPKPPASPRADRLPDRRAPMQAAAPRRRLAMLILFSCLVLALPLQLSGCASCSTTAAHESPASSSAAARTQGQQAESDANTDQAGSSDSDSAPSEEGQDALGADEIDDGASDSETSGGSGSDASEAPRQRTADLASAEELAASNLAGVSAGPVDIVLDERFKAEPIEGDQLIIEDVDDHLAVIVNPHALPMDQWAARSQELREQGALETTVDGHEALMLAAPADSTLEEGSVVGTVYVPYQDAVMQIDVVAQRPIADPMADALQAAGFLAILEGIELPDQAN